MSFVVCCYGLRVVYCLWLHYYVRLCSKVIFELINTACWNGICFAIRDAMRASLERRAASLPSELLTVRQASIISGALFLSTTLAVLQYFSAKK